MWWQDFESAFVTLGWIVLAAALSFGVLVGGGVYFFLKWIGA